MKDAYLPYEHKHSILGEDYQRIANELRDNGTEIEWTASGPKLKGSPEIDMSHAFMYPSIINFNNIKKSLDPTEKNT